MYFHIDKFHFKTITKVRKTSFFQFKFFTNTSTYLTTLTGKYVFLNLVPEFIETEVGLLPTFFLCLRNQLISIVAYKRAQMFEKCDSPNRQK